MEHDQRNAGFKSAVEKWDLAMQDAPTQLATCDELILGLNTKLA